MENHTNPESRLRAALVTRYAAQLAHMDMDSLITLAADLLNESGLPTNHSPKAAVAPAPTPASATPIRPSDRPVVGDIWKRKSNGNVVTITRVDVSTFSTEKQLKWPRGSKSRQLFDLSLFSDFVNEFELIKAGTGAV